MKRNIISMAVAQNFNLGKSRYSFRLRQEPQKDDVYKHHPLKSGYRRECGFLFFNGKLINL